MFNADQLFARLAPSQGCTVLCISGPGARNEEIVAATLNQRLFDGQHITPTDIERTIDAFLAA